MEMERGNWKITGGLLIFKDGAWADLFEGLDTKTTTKGLVRELFAYCFRKKDCSLKDIEDLYAIVGEFLERERMAKSFRDLERRIKREMFPAWGSGGLDFALYRGDRLWVSDGEIGLFGGVEPARKALLRAREAALRAWEEEHGSPFPHEEMLVEIPEDMS